MSIYAADVQIDLDQAIAARRADEQRRANEERLTPLEDRLRRLLTNIPIEAQREGLSLIALQQQLRARGRGRICHVGELGLALRRLGFERVRRWSNSREFGAVWRRAS
jgi:hypothetical protein